MQLRNHLNITSGYNIPFGITAVDTGFIFRDDNAWPHITRIVENFHEREVVMTTHIYG